MLETALMYLIPHGTLCSDQMRILSAVYLASAQK